MIFLQYYFFVEKKHPFSSIKCISTTKRMLDRATYGAVSKPVFIRQAATLINWSLLAYFLHRFGLSQKSASVVAVYTIITLCVWWALPSAVGISAVWCALYGALPHYTITDHVIFWIHNLPALLVPSLTSEWGPGFYWLSNFAHAASASSSFILFR